MKTIAIFLLSITVLLWGCSSKVYDYKYDYRIECKSDLWNRVISWYRIHINNVFEGWNTSWSFTCYLITSVIDK